MHAVGCKRQSSPMVPTNPRDLAELAARVQRIIDESGDPIGSYAHAWTKRWLRQPMPALGGLMSQEVV